MASYLIRKTFFGWTGRAKVVMPDMIGAPEADAVAVFGRVQDVGTRSVLGSQTIPAGHVIVHTPAGGVANYPDTVPVAYTVSTGPV